MSGEVDPDRALARLPRIDALLADAHALVARYGRGPTADALRAAVDGARRRLRAEGGAAPAAEEIVAAASAALRARRPGPPRRVINATGVLLHTNLGRAPLSEGARQAMLDAAGYCDVEIDLDSGQRGSRNARLEPLLQDATGAEAGIVVNNAAAALVLALATLAPGRAVVVSRGELVEIGGSFRLPEILAASGARLVEVGTTNRTRVRDYAAVDDAALLLKVHPSNFRVTGFTEEAAVAELASLARERQIPLLYDVGSGLLEPAPALVGEPTLRQALADGADVVVCSGDKLLGGPQAGLLVGRADLVDRCRRHPLARALRLDKLRIGALVATLEAHVGGRAATDLPFWRAMGADDASLRDRAEALAAALGGLVVDGAALVGGGAAPGVELPGPVVRVRCADADTAARRLRAGDPPVLVRVEDGAVWVDLRAVDAGDDGTVAERVREATHVG